MHPAWGHATKRGAQGKKGQGRKGRKGRGKEKGSEEGGGRIGLLHPSLAWRRIWSASSVLAALIRKPKGGYGGGYGVGGILAEMVSHGRSVDGSSIAIFHSPFSALRTFSSLGVKWDSTFFFPPGLVRGGSEYMIPSPFAYLSPALHGADRYRYRPGSTRSIQGSSLSPARPLFPLPDQTLSHVSTARCTPEVNPAMCLFPRFSFLVPPFDTMIRSVGGIALGAPDVYHRGEHGRAIALAGGYRLPGDEMSVSPGSPPIIPEGLHPTCTARVWGYVQILSEHSLPSSY